jgi:hypothetical protein
MLHFCGVVFGQAVIAFHDLSLAPDNIFQSTDLGEFQMGVVNEKLLAFIFSFDTFCTARSFRLFHPGAQHQDKRILPKNAARKTLVLI